MKIIKNFLCVFLTVLLLAVPVFAGKVAAFTGHINPWKIFIDDNQIYILEGAGIYIYSLQDYKFIKKFGKRGEGPEEFKGEPTLINVQFDYILVSSQRRVSFFTKKGQYIKEINNVNGRLFKPLGDNRFVGHTIAAKDDGRRYHTINIYDSNFSLLKETWKQEGIFPSSKEKSWRLFSTAIARSVVCDNKIFIVGKKDFVIDVFDKKGTKLFSIESEYEKVKFTETHKQKVLNLYKTRPSTKYEYDAWEKLLHFPGYFPAIRNIFADEKKLYVRTYREIDGKSEFYIFSTEGRLLRKIFLAIAKNNAKFAYPYMRDSAPYTFNKSKLYQLIENEETEKFELHVTRID